MALGKKSQQALSTCHLNLRKLVRHASKKIDEEKKRRKGLFKFDFTVRDGHREKRGQDKAVDSGLSKVKWPNSKHNKKPSQAIHLLPYPVKWPQKPEFQPFASVTLVKHYEKQLKIYVKQVGRFYQLHGFMLAASIELNIPMRWGGDWDRDGNIMDQSFDDLGHYEVVLD